MLFSELNNSKNELFPKSSTYAAEFDIALSFNNIFLVWNLIDLAVLSDLEDQEAFSDLRSRSLE